MSAAWLLPLALTAAGAVAVAAHWLATTRDEAMWDCTDEEGDR